MNNQSSFDVALAALRAAQLELVEIREALGEDGSWGCGDERASILLGRALAEVTELTRILSHLLAHLERTVPRTEWSDVIIECHADAERWIAEGPSEVGHTAV